MFSLTQLDVPGHRRQWMLMDMVTCLPLLYPLRYCVDYLGFRSLSIQAASLLFCLGEFHVLWNDRSSSPKYPMPPILDKTPAFLIALREI